MSSNHDQTAQGAQFPIHRVEDLVGPDGRAGLTLDGVLYTLRITKTGKLILTK